MPLHQYTFLPEKNIYRPYLNVSLAHPDTNKQTTPILALIDCGSDICMASMDIALWLGIQFDGSEDDFHIETANGSLSHAVKKQVMVSTVEKEVECPFFFVDGITPDRPLLLGQIGFFDQFNVCFDFQNKEFEIT